MKNFLRVAALAICAIFMVANVSAQVITAERASEIANQFFANGKQKSAAFRSTNATLTQSIDSRAVTGESNDAPTFHILTGADGKGFVIVSGEETENPIIGYSLDGTIDTNNLPDGFVGYMTDIDAQVRALREYNAANPQKAAARSAMQKAADYEYNATSMGNIVKNLNTAPWGQHGPFNNLCKTTDGQTALTGCGPTAFAILCYYYKWPASGVGTVTHQGTGENMELGHTYDYASMLHNYSSGYTTEQADAVALLMRDLGWANQVGYGTSSTSFSETGQHMVDHFRFKSERPVDHGASLAVVRSTLGNDTQWKTYIKNCLDAGYPIPYASTTNTSNSARHIYILDGYTDNDYYHFNWGWSGQGNGWFTLDNMVPDDYSNYSNSHKAFFNLIPDATTYTVTATATPSNMGTVSINGGTAGSTVTADLLQGVTATLTAHPADGYALASWTKNGEIVGTKNTLQVKVGTSDNEYVANFADASTVNIPVDYSVSTSTGSLNDSKGSQWTASDCPAGLKIEAKNSNKNAIKAITEYENWHKFYAGGTIEGTQTVHTSPTTFTLSVEDDYVITGYSMTYYPSVANKATLTNDYGYSNTPSSTKENYVMEATGLNTKSTTFTVTSTSSNYAIITTNFTVTVAKEGANVPSTPTTYTIYVNAETGGNAYVNGTNTSATVDAGTDVTLQAYPDGTNYTFAGWYNGNSFVSSNNPYTFALNSDVTYTAKFNAVATTYNITAEASPQNAGKVAINGGTQSTVANIDATSGSTVSLQAYPNSGYEFAGWYNGTTKVSSNNPYSITATAAVSYIASFQEVQQGGSSSTNLAGKYFRLKTTVNSAVKYMNVGTSSDNSHGNVNMVDLNESSDDQIFLFEQSGDGYKLKAKSGNYIKCAEWNVNANTTNANEASVLLFEESGDGYLINWYNTFKGAIKYFNVQTANAGDRALHPYSDGDKNSATVWFLEEVIPSLTVTFAGASWVNEASSWWEYIVTNQTPAVTVKAANSAKAIGYSTVSSVRHPYLLDGNSFTISLPANCKIVGYTLRYKGHNLNTKTFTYTGNNGTTATETVGQDGVEKTLTVTGLENNEIAISVSDQSSQAGVVIVALEITYIEEEFEPAMFKAEVEGWRNDNPNTHLGTITVGGTAMKLTPAHQTASELTMPVVEGTTLAFTRKYRGFEFNGFYIGATSLGTTPTLTADNVAAISDATPLVAKFTATNDVTLFYDDDTYSYRIPAIAKTGTNRLVAISDYRHSHDDIGRDNHGTGTLQVDLVMRTSEDNGLTWTDKVTIAEGNQNFGYGDAAVVANGQNILVMAVAGNVFFTNATSSNKQKTYRIYSADNGVTWEKEEVSSNLYTLFPNANGMFFGSGKLVVDPDFNDTGNARVYGAMLLNDGNNYVLYSDNWGETWNILGGTSPASANEPKVEILPNGQILLSSRRNGGRTFNVFTYTDKANSTGTWSTATNGCDNGGNGTNGEIICLDAKRPNGKPTKILLQSQPNGSDRRNVSIWYKEVSADETYTGTSIASDWTMGKQVSTQLSAYSAMCLQANGEIALFFEEAPCHNDDNTYGYSMVYVPLTIEEITGENFLNPNADVEYVPTEFNIVLTDAQDNEYRETLDYIPADVAAVESYLTTTYPFITLGTTGVIADNKYTNTVTLPFKVSNDENAYWHNIYWPANTAENDYPIYLSASAANDTYVPKVTESKAYGESTYNTLQNGDKISWAIYSVDNTLTFKFKNKLTGKYIQATSVATGNAQNVVYANENNATAFELLPDSYSYAGDYALVAKVGETTGYLCSTSATGYHYATHYNGGSTNRHEGAWIKFVEAPDYLAIIDQLIADIDNFGAGEGNYTDNNDIDAIKAIIEDIGTTPLNTLNTHTTTVQTVKDSYSEITLSIPVANSGSVKIKNEAVSNKFVQKGEVTIEAVPAAGYYFVNWTKPAAQTNAAARAAEARNAVEVVSTDNPYTFNLTDAVSLEANFEEILVNVTLTDAQSNTYNVELSGFTSGVTKETVAAKLKEAYPYITLGSTDQNGDVIDFGVLEANGTAYTYTNKVELPFKVSNAAYLWHNIYYPSNGGNPNYIAALNEDEVVDMAASKDYAYGDNPTYNTKDGGNSICWAIYNVNNSFEFIFKSRVTGKYIKVESVSSETTENVKFVENAEDATVFTLLVDTGTYNGDYALVANVEGTTGYLCATSSSKSFVTHYNGNGHQGAWVKFVEAPDYYSKIMDLGIMLGLKFGAGDGKYINTDAISEIDNRIANNSENITLNTIKQDSIVLNDAINSWPAVRLTINPVEGGTTNINGEAGVVHKYVPNDYELPLAAVPAEGYHFVSWTDGASEIETTEYTKTINGGKGDVTELTANFAINIYNISVTAGEGGSATASAATVEHGNAVTLTATPSSGYYSFAGWYDGENLISAEASYTFTVTSHINYTARFNEVSTGTVAIHITVASTDGTTVTNTADGNVKAIINNIGQGWATEADFVVGADVELVASSDYDQKAYLFDGWYKNDVLVSKELAITVQATEAATYQARFFRGCVVIGEPKSNSSGYVTKITLADGTSLGYDASNRAVVKEGTEVMINTWIRYGYETTWKDDEGNIVGNEQNLVITIERDVTYTATFEPATYNLTVRANDGSYGIVTAQSLIETGTNIKVGHNMEATITATANPGYYFVNWTKGTDVVSSENPYTIPGIANIEDMDDVEYIANFLPVENATTGTYYRIAYDFPAPAAAGAARAGATRAVGEELVYEISPSTGTPNTNGGFFAYWVSNNNPQLRMDSKANSGNEHERINTLSNGTKHSLVDGTGSGVVFTVSAPDGYVITGYSISGVAYGDITLNGSPISHNKSVSLSDSNLEVSSFSFTIVGGMNGTYKKGIDINSFEVTIVAAAPNTARYYMQSVACGVSGGNNLQNALKMTQDTLAASIFYYADSKLLSYDKGQYIIENGGTRGLQAVGVSGTVTITTSGETATISAPNYMHANTNGTVYYADHCGSDNGDEEHNFIVEEVTTLPVTITAALHATFYAPVAVAIPEGVKAYVLKAEDIPGIETYAWMTSLKNGIIPANTGVILRSDEAKTYYFDITENTDEARAEAVGNVLSGTVAKTKITEDAYILANREGKIGLYPVAKNSYLDNSTNGTTVRFTNNSHKAYLPVTNDWFGEKLKMGTGFRFVYDDEETTRIDEFETELEDTIYDLQGRKLSEITEPGIYIVGGKKVWIK